MGMKMINANGSKLDSTSFGRPWVAIVAAWDVKLLLIWLYVNPGQSHVLGTFYQILQKPGGLTVDWEPGENLASG